MAGTEEIIKNRAIAYRLLIIEAGTVALCGLLFFAFTNLEYVYSVTLGGLAFVVPNVLFVGFSLRTSTTNSGNRTLVWFFLGEVIKIVTTIMIFAISIILVEPLNIGMMFVSYGFVLMMNLTGLAIMMKQ